VTVLKLIFERIESETDTSHIKVNVSSLIRNLLQLLHAAPKDHAWAMRIRVKFCTMAHNLFEKRDFLALEKELRLRGELLEAFAEWAMIELPVSLCIKPEVYAVLMSFFWIGQYARRATSYAERGQFRLPEERRAFAG
jgi:hypothetical protein